MNNVEVTSYNQVLTVQPKIGPLEYPFRPYRKSWCCDSDSDLASEWFGEACVARRAFAADVKEVRRRVVSMGSEPEQTCTCSPCISRLQISEIDVRRIVKEILVGMKSSPGRFAVFPRMRAVSYSSTSSGCSSTSCSPGRSADLPPGCDGMYRQTRSSSCSSRSSVFTLESKSEYCQNNPRTTDFLPEVHSSPIKDYRSTAIQFDCNTPLNWPFPHYPPVTNHWTSSIHCPKCISSFDKDSLNSTLSVDSLNDISVFSIDSLNSLTDKDSLEYATASFSDDSLDSLDSCCNYDSLSDSKDSGFFSCSLPAVC